MAHVQLREPLNLTSCTARTAVHFQDVLERYSPYETLLEITVADGLNDTALAASFPLHTASPAASNTRLHEISEDAEDGSAGGAAKRPTGPANNTGAIFGTQRYKMERRVDQLMRADRPASPSQTTNDNHDRSPPPAVPQKPSVSHFLVREDSGKRSITSLSSRPSISESITTALSGVPTRSSGDTVTATSDPQAAQSPVSPIGSSHDTQPPIPERSRNRPSLGSERSDSGSLVPSLDLPATPEPASAPAVFKTDEYDPYDFSKFDYKPKVKLGPRPVVVAEKAKRPTTASIATVPSGYRQAAVKKQEAARPRSEMPSSVGPPLPDNIPAPPPIPDVPEYHPRPISRGSIKSLPSHKSGAMTPDKIRLMKAVELRKKQMRKSNPQQGRFVPPKEDVVPDVPEVPQHPDMMPAAVHQEKEMEQAPALETVAPPAGVEQLQSPTKKPDSGIEMDYDRSEDQSMEKQRAVPWQSTVRQQAPAVSLSMDHQVSPPRKSVLRSPAPALAPATVTPSSPRGFEPTMSMDMLESLPTPSFMQVAKDLSTLGVLNDGVGDSSHERMGLPSVPTIVMADGSRPISAMLESSQFEEQEPPLPSDVAKEPEVESDAATVQSPKRKGSDLAKRRRGMVQPLHIETAKDDEIDSDDDFYDELQSATFQEATPVTVARTPVEHVFDRRPSVASFSSAPSVKSINIVTRASTFPTDRTVESAEPINSRQSSAPVMDLPDPITVVSTPTDNVFPNDERPDPLSRRNVSTGISKRIQALSEMTSRDTVQANFAADVGALSPDTVGEFQQPADRASSLRSQSKSRTSSYHRHSKRVSNNPLTGPSAMASQSSNPWSVQPDPTTTSRSSISVSARIIRPTDAAGQVDSAPLQQSELVINHKRTSAVPKFDARLPRIDTETSTRSETASIVTSPPTSPTAVRSRSSTVYSTGRKSLGGRHKHQPSLGPSPDDFPPPPSHMITSGTSFMNWGDESVAPKEGSRTSRFFKRMSGIGGNMRKSVILPSVVDYTAPPSDAVNPDRRTSIMASQDRDTSAAIAVGDLNVQFSDSLMWKRRIVELDGAGSLIFSSPHGLDITKGLSKKFALSDFQIPYAPDLDRQELPYSVMLDFVNGSTMQVACEDTMAHRQALHVLRTHWKTWAGP